MSDVEFVDEYNNGPLKQSRKRKGTFSVRLLMKLGLTKQFAQIALIIISLFLIIVSFKVFKDTAEKNGVISDGKNISMKEIIQNVQTRLKNES